MEATKGSVKLTLAIYKRREYWFAFSPALKLFGYSKASAEEAIADFDKAFDTFLFVHTKLGDLQGTLLKLGWTRKDHTIDPPAYFNSEELINSIYGPNFSKREREVAIPA